MTVAGLTEVQLGKLAAERAASPEVKAFGQMMVRDHSRAGDELAKIATQLKVEQPKQPDEKHRELIDRLSKLQGAEFDREYMTAMVQGHEGVLSTVKTRVGNRVTSNQPAAGSKPSAAAPEATGTSGADSGEAALDKWAAKVLPTVQQHLERARAVSEKLK
jgi:predicted outer membrane protein